MCITLNLHRFVFCFPTSHYSVSCTVLCRRVNKRSTIIIWGRCFNRRTGEMKQSRAITKINTFVRMCYTHVNQIDKWWRPKISHGLIHIWLGLRWTSVVLRGLTTGLWCNMMRFLQYELMNRHSLGNWSSLPYIVRTWIDFYDELP